MNREIKFRAWDKKNKCWLTDKENVYINEEGEVFILVRGAASDYLSSVDVDIVWFTGLHDKNGKEIYEGDIFPSNSDGIKYYKVVFENAAFVVYHNHGYWGTLGKLIEIAPKFNFNIEIIGNIYENENLLSNG